MRTANIHEIRQELAGLTHKELVTLCSLLARNKKENKEFINYWLFERSDLGSYLQHVKKEISDQLETVNRTNLYAGKKTIRKVLRLANKYIRFSESELAETELRIHFCRALKDTGIALDKSTALTNLFNQQVKKIRQVLSQLHEDLQFDYGRQVEQLI
jgi:hypothetical protein